ncbi:MAG: hypothetical protein JWN17_2838 [Frankiales bacterium]|nr:hypothetical protein [Frankiales bacterium]
MSVPLSGSAPRGSAGAGTVPPGQPGSGFLPGHPVQGPPLVPVTTPPAPGAVPVRPRDRDAGSRPRRKPPLAWLPWALLAALLALLALMLLAATLAGPDKASGRASRAAAPAAAGAGALTAGGVDVLKDRASLARLASLQGKPAVGRGVLVQSVVADEGFWVGSSAADRTFVYLTPEARKSNGESGFQVRAGQRIDLAGIVTGTSAGDPQRFGVTDAEGARQLTAEHAYVRATSVRLSS